MAWLTKAKEKQLARKAADKVFGSASTHQVSNARKVIQGLIDSDLHKYIDTHNGLEKYYTIRSEVIIQDTAERLKPQQSLF